MTKKERLAKAYGGLLGEEVVVKQGSKGKNVVRMATVKTKRTLSEKQEASRDRLVRAGKYARKAMEDPALREFYISRSVNGKTAYREASNDFLRLPVIREIDISTYRGNPGDMICIDATDMIALTKVSLQINAADGTGVESGSCVEELPTGMYIYTTTTAVADISGLTVTVTVSDIPGNKVTKSITL
ncbi:MAG: hypothetical protein NTW16_11995 [Bacteroidetes bacterium]|nr:hypothetical protein [Bacteroidota bacterium]